MQTTQLGELVIDEVEFLRTVVALADADIAELGCGKAEMARKLIERKLVRSVKALEVDSIQHAQNCASAPLPGLEFLYGSADDIPLQDASCDLVIMLKSLHHVPIDRMDRSLREIHRVLKPGGNLYVSEPVFAGDFNEIVRIFHDEGVARTAAYDALKRAVAGGFLEDAAEITFEMPLAFIDFDDFFNKVVRVTHSELVLVGDKLAEVRERFGKHMSLQGARFVRPMRVNLLRKPA